MMEQGPPQGHNGVALADRMVRHLGIEVANAQISLATQNARLEELAEVASHIDLTLWDEVPAPPPQDNSHEGRPPLPPARFSVPTYQAEAVARLLSLLQPPR